MNKSEVMNVSKGLVLSVALLAGSLGLSCKARTTATASVNTIHSIEAVETVETTEQTPQKDGNGNGVQPECENPFGADSLETRKQISLYREQFKSSNYVEALPFWRYVYQNAPCVAEYVTADGAYLMSIVIGKTNPKDTAKIRSYADTLMQIYDDRMRFFGRTANVVGRKGRDMFKYYPEKAMDAIMLMRESFEGDGNNTGELLLYDLMLGTVQQNRIKKITDDEVIEWFDKISSVIDYNLTKIRTKYNDPTTSDTARTGQSMRYWEWVESVVVELGSPYLTCEKLTELYQPKFKATPNDAPLVEKIITLLKRSPNCSKTDFYLAVAEQYFKQNPSADGAAALAKAFLDRDENTKAKTYYEKAADLEADKTKKADYYITLGGIELSNSSCVSARNYARKALESNPKNGEAYMIIGNAYMACASGCGSNKVETQYPYLAAYDKFVQAKSVDPSVTDKANARMAIAAARFPEGEDLFFLSIKEGTTVNTGCWIAESTVVRARK